MIGKAMAVLTLEDCSASRAPGRLLRRLDKVMATYVASKFDGGGISFQQWVALKVVRDGTVTNAGELARELGITTGATTRMIDLLEARGLLMRNRAADDRRVVQVEIMPEGRAAVLTLQEHVVDSWNAVLADFRQEDVTMLVDLLARVLAAAERVTDGTAASKEMEA
jgi:DNA-binding MarR family transcriptional regulator